MMAFARAMRVLVAVSAATVTAACSFATYASGKSPDIPAAASAADAQVIASGSGENAYVDGSGAHWYVVSRDGSDGATVLVVALDFGNEQARDEAFRQIQYSSRRLPYAVVLTYGDAVVKIGRIQDRGLVGDLVQAMEDAGAK